MVFEFFKLPTELREKIILDMDLLTYMHFQIACRRLLDIPAGKDEWDEARSEWTSEESSSDAYEYDVDSDVDESSSEY